MSPRHRAWQRRLDSCTFDPDVASVRPIGERNFVICGHSRSGTALVTAALWHPPAIVTVMEPWDCFRMSPSHLFESLRSEVLTTGELSRGRLNVAALQSEGAVRWQRDGERGFIVDFSPDGILGVKMPVFWRLMPHLPSARFVVCLRDPVEVVSSYTSVGGRLAQGLDYDLPFNRQMNEHLRSATKDPLVRRVEMFDYVAERMIPYLDEENVHVVRYERWFTDPQGQLDALADFLGVDRWPLAVEITPPRSVNVDQSIIRTVAQHSRTATRLGYDAGRWLVVGSDADRPSQNNGAA